MNTRAHVVLVACLGVFATTSAWAEPIEGRLVTHTTRDGMRVIGFTLVPSVRMPDLTLDVPDDELWERLRDLGNHRIRVDGVRTREDQLLVRRVETFATIDARPESSRELRTREGALTLIDDEDSASSRAALRRLITSTRGGWVKVRGWHDLAGATLSLRELQWAMQPHARQVWVNGVWEDRIVVHNEGAFPVDQFTVPRHWQFARDLQAGLGGDLQLEHSSGYHRDAEATFVLDGRRYAVRRVEASGPEHHAVSQAVQRVVLTERGSSALSREARGRFVLQIEVKRLDGHPTTIGTDELQRVSEVAWSAGGFEAEQIQAAAVRTTEGMAIGISPAHLQQLGASIETPPSNTLLRALSDARRAGDAIYTEADGLRFLVLKAGAPSTASSRAGALQGLEARGK